MKKFVFPIIPLMLICIISTTHDYTKEETKEENQLHKDVMVSTISLSESLIKASCYNAEEYNPAYYIEAAYPEIADFDIVARVVAAESRGEPFEGQILVARCIWNTACRKGISMKEVVEMKNRYASPASIEVVTEELKTAVYYGILGIELPVEEEVEYFYSIKDGFYSRWHEENLEYVITIGNHKFFKEVS